MRLCDCTTAEAAAYLQNGPGGLIVPVGTCEQHGDHLPLGNDTLMVEHMAGILSDKTGLLIAPTLSYGVNLPLDETLAGTASLTEDILHQQVRSLLAWWRVQGFRYFILLTCHGDPFHLRALEDLGADVTYIEPEGEVELSDILDRQTCIRHACEGETSLALYLYPEKVRLDRIREHDVPFEDFRPYLFHEVPGQPQGYVGCLGYPSAATVQKGRLILERMVDYMMAQYEGFLATLPQ